MNKSTHKCGPYVTFEIYAFQEDDKPVKYILSTSRWNRSCMCGTHSPLSEKDVLDTIKSYMKQSKNNLK